MKMLTVLCVILCSNLAFAAQLNIVSCQRNSNGKQQDESLAACRKKMIDGQKCTLNPFEHHQSWVTYQVCLLEMDPSFEVFWVYKGSDVNEQALNLKKCRSEESLYAICVRKPSLHNQGQFDVALMRPKF